MDRIVHRLETDLRAVGQGQTVQPRILEVHHPIAPHADQVMVMARIGVKAGRRPEMVGSPDRAELDERFEHAIDGGARDLRDLRLDRLVDLLGGRVIVPLRHRLEDHAPLYRQRKAGFAAAFLEGAQPLGNLSG